MKITPQEVDHVARLARLAFAPEEKNRITEQLNRILEYMDQLNALDTTDVEPTSHVLPVQNVFKGDEVKPSFPREAMLSNAPDHTEEFYRVPKIIE